MPPSSSRSIDERCLCAHEFRPHWQWIRSPATGALITLSTTVRLKPVAMRVALPHEQLVVITSIVLPSSSFMIAYLL